MKHSKQMLTALMDASSAIILYKAGLHRFVCEVYNVIMPISVYREIAGNFHPGSDIYRQLHTDKKITIQALDPVIDGQPATPGLSDLDRGERDVVYLYFAGNCDFIITDDGGAAQYCQREKIPFINALLIPLVLKYAMNQTDFHSQEAFEKVRKHGRYSQWVIDFAQRCERKHLSFFLP